MRQAEGEDGRPCQQPVRRQGMACRFHGGPGAPASGRRTAWPRTMAPSWPSPTAPNSGWKSAVSRPPASVPSRSAASPGTTPAPPAPSPRRMQDRERVREAAEFCADSLSDGWQEAVADRITDYAGSTWQRLKRSHRKRNCKALARIARSILEAKNQIHKAVGRMFGWAAGALGADAAARAFAKNWHPGSRSFPSTPRWSQWRAAFRLPASCSVSWTTGS